MNSTATAPKPTIAPSLPPSGQIQPYLNFDGRCDEAIEFYRETLGAEVVQVVRFKDAPKDSDGHTHPPIADNKVLHCTMVIKGSVLHATDGHCQSSTAFSGISLSLTLPTAVEVRRTFEALAQGGAVLQPVTATFFTEAFGIVNDKFGVGWMVLAKPAM